MTETVHSLEDAIEAAVRARATLRRGPDEIAAALAAAAARWTRNAELVPALAEATGLTPAMIEAALPRIVHGFDANAMQALAERAIATADAARPTLVAHVLASNVPALALPAIAHALLVGAPIVVKSGRDDRVSAPTFRAALAAVDADLAATVVCVGWSRGEHALDDALLSAATVTVLTGSDDAVAALARRARGRVVTFGTRWSAAIVADAAGAWLDALAEDVALYEQRGCLSPHAVAVRGDAESVGVALADALARRAAIWPPATLDLEARAERRSLLDDAEWAGSVVHAGDWGTVVVERPGPLRPVPGHRCIRVQPLAALDALPERLPAGRIECIGTTGPVPHGIEALGVSRVCRVGDMQRPSLAWPRGGLPPLRMLLDPDVPRTMEDAR